MEVYVLIMEEIGVGPEEPIFYGLIIGFMAYFLWNIFRWIRESQQKRAHKKKWDAALLSAEEQLEYSKKRLYTLLSDRYGATIVADAFAGEVSRGMSLALLKIALGNPSTVDITGVEHQTWRYSSGDGGILLIHVKNRQVIDWQKIKTNHG